jgi:hypothetical protein
MAARKASTRAPARHARAIAARAAAIASGARSEVAGSRIPRDAAIASKE